MLDTLQMSGQVTIDILDQYGNWLGTQQVKNRVVAGGRTFLASKALGDSLYTITDFGVGTGIAAVLDTDTALGTSLLQEQASAVVASAGVITMQHYIPSSNQETLNANLTEAGMFASYAGAYILVARLVFSEIEKTASNALLFTWTVTLASV